MVMVYKTALQLKETGSSGGSRSLWDRQRLLMRNNFGALMHGRLLSLSLVGNLTFTLYALPQRVVRLEFLHDLLPFLLFLRIASSQGALDIDVFPTKDALDGFPEKSDFGIRLAGEVEAVVPQADHLNGVGADQESDDDEKGGRVPVLGFHGLGLFALGDRHRIIGLSKGLGNDGLPN